MTDNAFGDRFLRIHKVSDKVGLQRTAIYDKISTGDFPPPIKLGNVSVWLESEVDEWIRLKVAEFRKAG